MNHNKEISYRDSITQGIPTAWLFLSSELHQILATIISLGKII